MHTKDFSKAPSQAQGTAIFFGGTRYGGILALLRLIFVWRRVSRRMKASPGYRWHTVWYQFPFTIGTISVWDSREDMLRFAQSEEHTDAVEWLLRPGMARGARSSGSMMPVQRATRSRAGGPRKQLESR